MKILYLKILGYSFDNTTQLQHTVLNLPVFPQTNSEDVLPTGEHIRDR